MRENIIQELLEKVKSNKKYQSISDEIVLNEIKNYLEKNPIDKITKENISEIRNQLHKSYSSFQTKKKNKIKKYLEELKQNPNNLDITNKLLSVTLSTKERLPYYKEIYKQIFEITGTPKSITDLGAGFNIFSFPLMHLNNLTYYSYDIDEEDIIIINDYIKIMKKNGLIGEAKILDLRNKEKISHLPYIDVIFLFKLIDIIDKENHKPGEELIKQLTKKTRYIVASFATKTITRKKMNYPNRKWFELMLNRLNLDFKKFNTDNEVFYIIYHSQL